MSLTVSQANNALSGSELEKAFRRVHGETKQADAAQAKLKAKRRPTAQDYIQCANAIAPLAHTLEQCQIWSGARRARDYERALRASARALEPQSRLRLSALRTLAALPRRVSTARARQRRPRRAALRQLCRSGRGRKRHRGGSDGDPDGGVTDAVATDICTDVRDGARVSS